ncbi:class I SAM-dependent methyltransferase [Planctomycetota bacterium]
MTIISGCQSTRSRLCQTEPDQTSQVRRFFEAHWESGGREWAKHSRIREFRRECVEDSHSALAPVTGCTVLEVGPGLGDDSWRLASEEPRRLVLLDISEKALKLARSVVEKHGGRAAGVVSDCHHPAFAGGRFERVFGSVFLMHVEWDRALEALAGLVTPGGRLVIVEPLRWHPLIAAGRWISRFSAIRPRYVSLRELTAGTPELELLSAKAYYVLSPVTLVLSPMLPDGAFLRLSRWLQRTDRWLLARFPPFRHLAWMAVVAFRRKPHTDPNGDYLTE